MAFTTAGLNRFLQEFKAFLDGTDITLVALAPNGDFIAGGAASFGDITNNVIDLDDPIVFSITAGNEVRSLSLFDGVVTNQSTMGSATQLAQITFASGTYNFTSSGSLTISEFKISVQN